MGKGPAGKPVRIASDEHAHRVFDVALEGGEQFGAERAIDGSRMVGRKRDGHHIGDDHLLVLDDDTVLAGADREDRRVGAD